MKTKECKKCHWYFDTNDEQEVCDTCLKRGVKVKKMTIGWKSMEEYIKQCKRSEQKVIERKK